MERLTEKIDEYNRYFVKEPAHLNCTKVVQRLGAYEDAEEQGLLLRLPCKVGDTVYLVGTYRNPSIDEMGVEDIFLRDGEVYIGLIDITDSDYTDTIRGSDFGKTVFLTREEAEKALADMGV